MTSSIHLGFDMGIRNLAFCLMEHTSDTAWTILAWDNVDLLSGGASAQDARRCVGCAGPATWCHGTELWCKGCATGVRRKKSATRTPIYPHLPCTTSAKDLRTLGVEKGWADKKMKKDALFEAATRRYLMPWKAPKATSPSLAHIRSCMDSWLDRMLPTFARATLIRLENQPVMKGPTMKSIQIMLFTLLGHRLEREQGWKGSIVFVHAGVKTRGAEAVEVLGEAEEAAALEGAVITEGGMKEDVEDEGKAYRARKKTAEAETLAALQKIEGTDVWRTWFEGRSKKSDLADAFLMALRKN